MPNRKDKIRKRKDGRWEGRYFKERRPDGKIRYASVYGKSFQDVKRKLDEALKTQPTTALRSAGNMTVKETGELWLQDEKAGLKASTIWRYRFLLESHIYPTLGNTRIRDLTQPVIQVFAKEIINSRTADRKKKLSDAYVNSILIVLLDLQKYAVKEKLCSPLSSTISRPTPKKAILRVLSMDEMRKLVVYLNQNPLPITLGIEITLYAGLRVGEVCALQWKHINLDNKIISVQQTIQRVRKGEGLNKSYLRLDVPKTPSSLRQVPIHPDLLVLLQKRKETDGSKYVVTGTAQFANPATYEYQYHKILKEAGIEDINYHALRHSFTTSCVESGMDIKTLSEILGHAKVTTTLDIYTHPTIQMKQKEIKKLPSMLTRS